MKKMNHPSVMGRYSGVMVIIIESGFVYCVAGVSLTPHFGSTMSCVLLIQRGLLTHAVNRILSIRDKQ